MSNNYVYKLYALMEFLGRYWQLPREALRLRIDPQHSAGFLGGFVLDEFLCLARSRCLDAMEGQRYIEPYLT
jgi:hypothetical protein